VTSDGLELLGRCEAALVAGAGPSPEHAHRDAAAVLNVFVGG
jgi:hypothetical protein